MICATSKPTLHPNCLSCAVANKIILDDLASIIKTKINPLLKLIAKHLFLI